ncbi:hypothetical protein [Curtobacterium sp. MCJR17_020]|uniref:hypothetical protein n=1 Tax=Curtobacterium sp. MCJR17_020 TaxID=2175619 RepID=UPI0011B7823D|nr:hypothetical protein [Curtobacterium sp. MCJR17_020]WIE72357.1 hypothetical protein DEJ14_000960 [Curtobacterium sp. MCJR17_020]
MNLLGKLALGTSDIRRNLEEKLASGYLASDVGRAARDASALWETTLVASGHNWTNTYLYNQTEDLAALGWTGAPDLHLIRRTNNDAKHGTPISATADDILVALQRLERLSSSLEPIVPGLRQNINEPRLRRIVCAIYDYFAQGETEFAFLEARPADTWMTCNRLDAFQVNSTDEAEVRAGLEMLDGWKYDPSEFEDLRSSLRESDNELWRIATFTAQYEDAYSIVSQFQHDRKLLRGLHRDDDLSNVLVTLCLVRSRDSAIGDVDGLLRAAAEAGLVSRRRDLRELAAAVIGMFNQLASERHYVIIVDRANPQVYDQERERNPLAVDPHHGLLMTQEGVLFVRTP